MVSERAAARSSGLPPDPNVALPFSFVSTLHMSRDTESSDVSRAATVFGESLVEAKSRGEGLLHVGKGVSTRGLKAGSSLTDDMTTSRESKAAAERTNMCRGEARRHVRAEAGLSLMGALVCVKRVVDGKG